MASMAQKTLFGWDQIEAPGDLKRLQLVVENLPDEALMRKLEQERDRGRDDYPIRAMWNALVSGVVFQHPTVEALPNSWAFSRFLAQVMAHGDLMQRMFDTPVDRLSELLPDCGVSLAVDGKALASYQIKRAKPDVVCFPALRYEAVNSALRQAKKESIKATFFGSDAWDTPQLDSVACDGSYYTTHFWAGDPRPEVQSYLKAYGDKYKDDSGKPVVPDFISDEVKTAIERISFNAVTGRITMDAQHNAIKNVILLHVTGGKVLFDSSISP